MRVKPLKILNIIGLIILGIVLFCFIITYVLWSPFYHDNSEDLVANYIIALIEKDYEFIEKNSNYKLNDFSWINNISTKAEYYSDTGPFWTEYWVRFSNGFVLYIETTADKTGKWYVSRINPTDRTFDGETKLKKIKN